MSYLEYFKFSRQPFSEHASREALWNDTRMEEGLSRLNHLLGNGLVGLVTGASGLGKRHWCVDLFKSARPKCATLSTVTWLSYQLIAY